MQHGQTYGLQSKKTTEATKGAAAAAAAATAPKDPIAGALQRFALKQPTRPVGVSKIDLASSFTDASSPANAPAAAASVAGEQCLPAVQMLPCQQCHVSCTSQNTTARHKFGVCTFAPCSAVLGKHLCGSILEQANRQVADRANTPCQSSASTQCNMLLPMVDSKGQATHFTNSCTGFTSCVLNCYA